MDFDGLLYRAVDPAQFGAPLSGEGAARHAQRFNVPGMAALYTSMRPETVLREKMQDGPLQPLLLVAVRARLRNLLDGRDPAVLARFGTSSAKIGADDWQDEVAREGRSAGQALAVAVRAAGHCGLVVPSYAKDAGPGDVNLVLWDWDGVSLVDDAGCLKQMSANHPAKGKRGA